MHLSTTAVCLQPIQLQNQCFDCWQQHKSSCASCHWCLNHAGHLPQHHTAVAQAKAAASVVAYWYLQQSRAAAPPGQRIKGLSVKVFLEFQVFSLSGPFEGKT